MSMIELSEEMNAAIQAKEERATALADAACKAVKHCCGWITANQWDELHAQFTRTLIELQP